MRFFKNKLNLIIAGVCMAFLFSGCAKAPFEELAAAKAAIQKAKDAEADKYMVNNFKNLEKALKMAEDAIVNQQSKFFMTRKYKNVTDMLQKTVTLANDIAADAPKKKAEMVDMLKGNIGLVDGMLEATAKDIKKNRRKKDKAVIEELDGYLTEADSAAVKAKAAYASADYFTAKDKLEDVQMYINKITSTLKPPKEE